MLYLLATVALITLVSGDVHVSIDRHYPEFHVYKTYLSFNIDSGSLYNEFDFKDVNLRNLVKGLVNAAPTQVRIGGSAADDSLFTGEGGLRGNCRAQNPSFPICIDTTYWDEINEFIDYTGAKLVFDISVRYRKNNNTEWDSSNAEKLFEYTIAKKYYIDAWQLGNEAEEYYRSGLNVTGEEIGRDYLTFANLLNRKFPALGNSIYGPDACCEMKGQGPAGSFLKGFTSVAKDVLKAVTIHDYPVGRAADKSCVPSLYTNITTFTSLKPWLAEYIGFITSGGGENIPIILGETASTAEGGCDGLSNRFIAGFVFMYELGSVGESHVSQVFY